MSTSDVLVVGGGVIGLSAAWSLARRGLRVTVLERDKPGRGASWAGAGIIAYQDPATAQDTYGAAMAEAARLHPIVADTLYGETGIHNGYAPSGELTLDLGDGAAYEADRARALGTGSALQDLDATACRALEPGLSEAVVRGFFMPEVAQLRPPRHLAALLASLRHRGVEIVADAGPSTLIVEGGRAVGAETAEGVRHDAGAVVLASGAWTPLLTEAFGFSPPITPVRGQIVLLEAPILPVTRIISVGLDYVLPRPDGHVLVGATREAVGFDARTTAGAVEGLLGFALRVVPALAGASVLRAWAGLRPMTPDGRPIVGPVPGIPGAFVAAGHSRQGLTLAPATGEELGRLIDGGV